MSCPANRSAACGGACESCFVGSSVLAETVLTSIIDIHATEATMSYFPKGGLLPEGQIQQPDPTLVGEPGERTIRADVGSTHPPSHSPFDADPTGWKSIMTRRME